MKQIFRYRMITLWLCLGGMSLPSSAQNYFKQLAESDKYFKQRITHFPNGDLLIGDSSIEALRTGNGGKIYMTRLDPCGNVLWSRSYERREEYLEFKDFQINEANEIFVYGSAYLGLDEFIFFLKLDSRGNLLNFRLFEPETVDHFSYSIDLRGNQLMAYGLILDFGTKKYGFVAMFDQNLNFKWGVKFSPFESTGDARITTDNGFICRSGPYLFKLDSDGQLEWARALAPNVQNNPIGGPLELNDGYLLEAYGQGFGFFYKVDRSGDLIWKSDLFPTKSFSADMSLLPNDHILAVYSTREAASHQLNYLILSPEGNIIQQQQLNTGMSLKPGRVYQSLGNSDKLAISANFDTFSPEEVDVAGFLIQSTWPTVPNDCFVWETALNTQPNEVSMVFAPLDTVTLATSLELYSNTGVTLAEFRSPLSNACLGAPAQSLFQIDTVLACGEEWTVALPSAEFIWADGQTVNPRIISRPGTYQAGNQDCGNPLTYTYTLTKPGCACKVYLPTAFSPNQDSRNDELELFSDCDLTEIHLLIFNRWGEKVFESRTLRHFWDGLYRGLSAPGGLYLVALDYEWQDPDGAIQRGAIRQAITLVR